MINKTLILGTLVCAWLLWGCNNTDDPSGDAGRAVRFSPSLTGMTDVDTRSPYAVITPANPLMADVLMGGASNDYSTATTRVATFTSVSEQTLSSDLLYPFPASDRYFRAFSPATKWTAGATSATSAAGAADGKTDLMYTPQAGPYTTGTVPLTFQHALALVRVYVRVENSAAATAWGDLTDLELEGITDGAQPIPTGVTLDYATNSVSETGGTTPSLAFYKINRLSFNNPYTNDAFTALAGVPAAGSYLPADRVAPEATGIASVPAGYVMTACPATGGLGNIKLRLKSVNKTSWVSSTLINTGSNTGAGKCVDVYLRLNEDGKITHELKVDNWNVTTQYKEIEMIGQSWGTINLSLKETANSYICRKAGQAYTFNATVQGNGTPTPGNDGLASTTGDNNYTPTVLTPSAGYTAKVLWSMGGITPSTDTDGGDATNVDNGLYSVIKKGSLAYDASTGYITFETTAATLPADAGNAVIGLFSGTTLLWSWHIWFTDYNPDVQYDAYKTAAAGHPNPLLMMKYNLGATDQSGALSNVANAYKHGFNYQWGRKDPFLGGVTETTNCTAGTQYYYNKAAGVADFVYNGTGGSLALGYGNPMRFYIGSAEPYDWQGSTLKNDLWGNPGITWVGTSTSFINSESGIKTCFDPCPPGWKVPPRGTWNTIFATTVVTHSGSDTPNVLGSFSMGYNFYYTAVGSGPTTFYPALGSQNSRSTGTPMYGVGSNGYYWCSSPASNSSYYAAAAGSMLLNAWVWPLRSVYDRACGFGVRCAQE